MDNQDLEQIIKLCANQQEAIGLLAQQINGLTAVHQILLEVLLSVSPTQKQAVSEALSQLLARPDLIPDTHMQAHLRSLLEVAKRPSRTSPEGRRAWLYLVSSPDNDQPEQ